MANSLRVLGVVGSAAGGLDQLCAELVRPAQDAGWTVGVTLTPTAGRWLREAGRLAELERVTGLPVRIDSRLPSELSPHPPVDCYVVAPASANTVAKLALGIGDNQALTQVCEAIGMPEVPVVVFPRASAAYLRHPAWEGHLAALRSGGVELVYGPDVWPLSEPRSDDTRQLPWDAILDAVNAVSGA